MGGIGAGEIVLLTCVGLSLTVMLIGAFLGRKAGRVGPDHGAISQYREWQRQAASWSDYFELEDMIDEERAKGP